MNISTKIKVKYFLYSFSILLLCNGLDLVAQDNSTTDAFQQQQTAKKFDQRGYGAGASVNVDGKLQVSNSNGNVTYSYPISNRTIQGFQMTTSLNYCGSVGFTAFGDYLARANYYTSGTYGVDLYSNLEDRWDQFHQTRPAWILGFNGFAIQLIGFNPMYCINPQLIHPGTDNGATAKHVDNNFNWVIEGYDYCNRMQDLRSNNDQDVIKILKADGSILELRNGRTPQSTPLGTSSDPDQRPELFTGHYYVNEPNAKGFGIVEYDDAYLQQYQRAEFLRTFGNTNEDKWNPFRPRKLHYYPGDGLEYVFCEWISPYGRQHYSYTGGRSGIWSREIYEIEGGADLYKSEFIGATRFGGWRASPSIFYLEDVKDGSVSLTYFKRSRHFPLFSWDIVEDDATKGRAPLTEYEGHMLTYYPNSMTIEALGRTITIKYDSVLKEGYRSSTDYRGIPWGEYGNYSFAKQIAQQSVFENSQYRSYLGMVTSIIDPEERITQFGYENYYRNYLGFRFPTGETYEADAINLRNNRLISVIEPTSKYELHYNSSTTRDLHYDGTGENSPYSQKYNINIVDNLKKYSRENNLLTESIYNFSTDNNNLTGVLNTVLLKDYVSGLSTYSSYSFEKKEISPFVTNSSASFRTPYLNYSYLKESRVSGEGITSITKSTEVDTDGPDIIGGSRYLFVPKVHEVQIENSQINTTLVKSYQKFGYSFTTGRTYNGLENLATHFGKEVSTDTAFVYAPDAITSSPLFYKTNSYLQLPYGTENVILIDSNWMKFLSIQRYYLLRDSLPEFRGKSWEYFFCHPGVMIYRLDTLSDDSTQTPPYFGLPTNSTLWDGSGTLLQGKSTKFQEMYASDGKLSFCRGLARADTIIGKNGTRKITSGLYDYSKWTRIRGGLLSYKKNANGSIQDIFYDYDQPAFYQLTPGEICPGYVYPKALKLDNVNAVEEIEFEPFSNANMLYESSLGEQSRVRKYKRSGDNISLDTTLLTQMYERGYYGQMITSMNPNGWYSRYTYDKNGRLELLQLPGDFASTNQTYTLESTHSQENIVASGCTGISYLLDSVSCRMETNGVKTRNSYHVRYVNFGMQDCSVLYASRDPFVYQECPCGDPPIGSNQGSSSINHDKTERTLQTLEGLCNVKLYPRFDERHYAEVPFGIEKLKESGTVLDSVLCSLHITSVQGNNVNMLIEFPQLDTVINYVLMTSDNQSDDDQRQFLSINLSSKFSNLFTLAGQDSSLKLKISVLTQGAKVTFANDAEDVMPRLILYGRFKDKYGRSDFTMKYTYDDYATPNPLATITYKTDDRLHSANSWTEDTYARRWSAENEFGTDYTVKKSTTRIGTPNSFRSDEISSVYTGFGQPTSVTDQDGNTVHTSYDALGRADTVTNADNTLIRMNYDVGTPSAFSISGSDYYGFCAMQKTIDEKGLEIRQYYDAFDRLRKEIIDSGGIGHLNLITLYDYDIQGRLKKVTNPSNQATDYWYDDFGRVKYKRQPDMGIMSYSYDNVGNTRFSQTKEQSSKNKFTYYEYDDLNRVSVVGEALIARTVAPDTGITTSDNLNLHRWTDEIDPTILHDESQSALLTSNKTLWSNLAAQIGVPLIMQPPYSPAFSDCVANEPYYPETFGSTLPVLKQFVFGNSPFVFPATVANFEDISLHPEFVRLVIHYDELPTRAGAIWGNFTPANRTGIWDSLAPKGKVRNLRGQQAAVAYRDKASEAFHYQVYSYDERGRVEALLRFTENIGYDAVYYTYNSANQVVEQRVADPWRQTVTWYGYDWNGRIDTVSTQIYPNGTGMYHSMTTSLDSLKRPQPYTKPFTGVARVVYSYTKRGMVEKMLTLQPQLTTNYTYNSRGFLNELSCLRGNDNIFTEELDYDVDGQITAQHYQQGAYPVATLNYDYDNRKQLISWGNTAGHTDYSYDNVGNRKSTRKYDGGNYLLSTDGFVHNFGTNRLALRNLSSGGSITYSYYADGAMQRSVFKTYTGMIWENKVENFGYGYNGLLTTYNLENMYSNNVNCFDDEGPFKWEWSYRYSPGGERESKRLTTTPLGDGLSSHNWNYYLLGGNKQQLAVYNGRETSRGDCNSTGHRVDFFASEYLTYGNGSTPLITTRPTGDKEYLVVDHLGSTRAVVNGSGTVVNITDYEPFGKPLAGLSPRTGYIGKEKDYESDLADHGVRKYDYDAGIFRSIDPLWEKYRGWSPYQYGANNPLRYIDYNGQEIDVSAFFLDSGDEAENTMLSISRSKLLNDLREKTGLNLMYSDNRLVNNGLLGGGSATARDLLLSAINSKSILEVTIGGEESEGDLGGLRLNISSKQTENNMLNTPEGLNKTTMGYALAFIHELMHTALGGATDDGAKDSNPGPTEDRVNSIRMELDSSNTGGGAYGKRSQYKPEKFNNRLYIPFLLDGNTKRIRVK